MPLPVYRLRRWLAVIAAVFTVVIAGMYLSARLRQRNMRKEVPGKIAYDIKQTASGFQFSKSEGGRTIFVIRAGEVKEFKLNGRAELHNVSITLYGRDASRFDQIYGDDFIFDPKTGDVTAKGEVQIDLEANPAGVASPDQAPPKALKDAIHLKTSDLIFNRDSGNATTDARVDLRTPQASGSAVGVRYTAHTRTLTLLSQVQVNIVGAYASTLTAQSGRVTDDPRQVVLNHPRLVREGRTLQADLATFFLNDDNNVDHVRAEGNVLAATNNSVDEPMRARADQADLHLTGSRNQLSAATLSGNVQVDRLGDNAMQGDAQRVDVDFSAGNRVQKVRASGGVRLLQHATTNPAAPTSSTPQDLQLTAPAINFFVAGGRHLDRAETSGAAQITVFPSPNSSQPGAPPQRTVITAGRFTSRFEADADSHRRLASLHGEPDARIVNSVSGEPDRVSTSRTIDAAFLPKGGIESFTQQGNVVYNDGRPLEKRTESRADLARYTPADQILVLTGKPGISGGGMATTANLIRINRATGDVVGEGDVKTTYSELKEQPNGALLASASPIHVTASAMTLHHSTAVAQYTGDARLWQDANIISAPSITFDRDRRFVQANGNATQPVSTVLVQASSEQKTKVTSDSRKSSRNRPVTITSTLLTYTDAERKAHYEGSVVAKGSEFTASAHSADAYLLARSQTSGGQSLGGTGQLDHMVADGAVSIIQRSRRAVGQKLLYTAGDEKFVLSGGPPSIFDAERGKITGVSLTFFNRDDRVLVEGETSTPVVTQTRVAH